MFENCVTYILIVEDLMNQRIEFDFKKSFYFIIIVNINSISFSSYVLKNEKMIFCHS